jgi:hypothetical protein
VRIDDKIVHDVDAKPKPRKDRFSRPSFSLSPNSWEIDLLIGRGITPTYFVAININTRYLYLIPIKNKSGEEMARALEIIKSRESADFGKTIDNIRGDGEKGFSILIPLVKSTNFDSSPYTFHNKIVDAVIRTLRNALGVDSNHLWDGRHDDIIQQLVDYYNNTYHRSIKMTPLQMHTNIDLEWRYIRKMMEVSDNIKKEQSRFGLRSY